MSFNDSAAHLTPPSTPPPEKREEFQQPAGDTASRVTDWWDQPEQPPVEVKPAENAPANLPPAEGAVATEGWRAGAGVLCSTCRCDCRAQRRQPLG